MPDRWEFSNDSFRRGERRLLRDIQRRKISPAAPAVATPVMIGPPITVAVPANRSASPSNSGGEQVLSSNSSPPPTTPSLSAGGSSDLVEENERLRRENRKLSNELERLKNLCNNIYVLMSKYAGGCRAPPALPAEELDLLPGWSAEAVEEKARAEEEEEQSPRLFGVSIGSKRVREDEGEDPIDRVEADADVKSEPIEAGPDPNPREEGNDEGPWLLCGSRPNPRACSR